MTLEIPDSLARVHAWARKQPWLRRFTLLNRLLLATAFLPTGLVKLTGQRFTVLPVENPVGFFFEAMYRTGPYWHFVGLVQVLAAILLLIPRTALLGALMFLPVGISILLITWGVGFGGTVWVAAGMLLSVVYLLCWDGDRLWAAGSHLTPRSPTPALLQDAHPVEIVGWVLGGAAGFGLLLTTRSLVPITLRAELFYGGALGAALVVAGWLLGVLRTRGARPGAPGADAPKGARADA